MALVFVLLLAADEAARLLEAANAAYRALRSAEAVRLYRQYLERYPERADVRVFLGSALLNLDRPDDALAEANRALELQPDCPSRYQLARIYHERGRGAEAEAVIREGRRCAEAR